MSTDLAWVPRMAARDAWLAQVREEIIDPDREIVDPHHHLWVREGIPYQMEELWADTGSGHNIVQTMFMECRAFYDEDAAEAFQPIGETRTVADWAIHGRRFKNCAQIAGIIGHADLRNPDLDTVLNAHVDAGQGLFRGIRHAGACDSDPALRIRPRGEPGMYHDPDFHRGVARLGARGLTYDTWQYHHQLGDFLSLAQAVPETTLVLDHLSTPLGVGRFAGQRDSLFAKWQDEMAMVAECHNVVVKLGGMAMPDNGFGWHERDLPPTSDEFVEAMAPWYEHMINCFGVNRCMFESNFPVDRISISYPVLWNGLKKLAADYSEADQIALFSGTARAVYTL